MKNICLSLCTEHRANTSGDIYYVYFRSIARVMGDAHVLYGFLEPKKR